MLLQPNLQWADKADFNDTLSQLATLFVGSFRSYLEDAAMHVGAEMADRILTGGPDIKQVCARVQHEVTMFAYQQLGSGLDSQGDLWLAQSPIRAADKVNAGISCNTILAAVLTGVPMLFTAAVQIKDIEAETAAVPHPHHEVHAAPPGPDEGDGDSDVPPDECKACATRMADGKADAPLGAEAPEAAVSV